MTDVSPSPSSSVLLSVEDLRVAYRRGGSAVDGATFELSRGGCALVLGPNGAGKTSLVRGIAGFLPYEGTDVSGSVRLDGAQIVGRHPTRNAREGLCFIPERAKVFRSLSVRENLKIFGERRRGRESSDEDLGRVFELFPVIGSRLSSQAGLLSGGEQQMLALGGALLSRPDLLVVDEPCLGLSPILITQVLGALAAMKEAGISLLLVDQNMRATEEIADDVYSMRSGRLVAEDADAFRERLSVRGYHGAGS